MDNIGIFCTASNGNGAFNSIYIEVTGFSIIDIYVLTGVCLSTGSGRGWLPSMHHRSQDWVVCIQGAVYLTPS